MSNPKVILVTGSSTGFGRLTAQTLARQGMRDIGEETSRPPATSRTWRRPKASTSDPSSWMWPRTIPWLDGTPATHQTAYLLDMAKVEALDIMGENQKVDELIDRYFRHDGTENSGLGRAFAEFVAWWQKRLVCLARSRSWFRSCVDPDQTIAPISRWIPETKLESYATVFIGQRVRQLDKALAALEADRLPKKRRCLSYYVITGVCWNYSRDWA